MKKIFLSIAGMFMFGFVAFAQSTSATNATPATQTVNAADMQNTDAAKCDTKNESCSSSSTKSCCSGHNRSDMNSSSASNETTGAELSKSAENCKTVSFGMSAEKPKNEETSETPKQ